MIVFNASTLILLAKTELLDTFLGSVGQQVAVSEGSSLVAIDDKQGINACKLLRTPFATAINILLRMREKGLVGRDESLVKLEALGRYGRYRAEILEDARRRLEET